MKNTHYTMESSSVEIKNPPGSSRRRGSKSDSNSDDTEGSLDYSSGASYGSTDSNSFADILKVLEGPEMTTDLAHYLQQQQQQQQHPKPRDDKSIAESSLAYSSVGSLANSACADGESQMIRSHFTGGGSLAYSAMTDGESHMMRSHWTDNSTLRGAEYVSAFPGPPSDTGTTRQPPPPPTTTTEMLLSINDQILFSPAEHADSMKLRKQRKKQRKLEQKLRQLQEPKIEELRSAPSTPPTAPPTPPSTRPPKATTVSNEERILEDDDIWYAKWWALCFPDTFKAMTFKG